MALNNEAYQQQIETQELNALAGTTNGTGTGDVNSTGIISTGTVEPSTNTTINAVNPGGTTPPALVNPVSTSSPPQPVANNVIAPLAQ